uniref:BED-type domain-containing protein n=1 Tax=Lactuca sativa TaxID=4236 RepID=A0A9R1XBS9_LACSA|nr:hypothetical protein LSAT_V11C500240550 [Lactuca sativa]
MFIVMLITFYLSFCSDIQDQQPPQPSVEPVAENTNRRLTSKVWKHFKKQKIDGVYKEICNYCNKKLSGISKNGTTHLHEHYRKCRSKNNRDIRQSILNPRQEKKMGLYHLVHIHLIKMFLVNN